MIKNTKSKSDDFVYVFASVYEEVVFALNMRTDLPLDIKYFRLLIYPFTNVYKRLRSARILLIYF